MRFVRSLAAVVVAWIALCAPAHAQMPQYGTNINQEQAKKALVAAEAEARKNGWPMAIAIVDTAGQMVAFTRMDNTQTGSIQVSQDKAVSAAMFRRPTKVFQDLVAKGGDGLRILGLKGASPIEGGLPIVVDGKIIGAIGVAGVFSAQDAQIARAGLAAIGNPSR